MMARGACPFTSLMRATPQQRVQFARGHRLDRARRRRRAGRGLREGGRPGGVEGDSCPLFFCITWWIWPFRTVTEPNRFSRAKAWALSSVPQPHSA